jgi:8-oxo-dGTP pyrophosphatase MutT (NUDIX family)
MPDMPAVAVVRPRPAACLILVDRSTSNPRMLMGLRHGGHRFMPDVFVFPGGRVERSDFETAKALAIGSGSRFLDPRCPKRPTGLARALVAAALREMEEEAGIRFDTAARAPALFGGLRLVARALTPVKLPRRFDTRFFMLDRNLAQTEAQNHAGPDTELVELRWVTSMEALALPIHEITRTIVEAIRPALLDPAHGGPIPFFTIRNGMRRMTSISM